MTRPNYTPLTPAQRSLLELSRVARQAAQELEPLLTQACGLLADTLLAGRQVLVCGNGGSAADAQHFAAELVGRMGVERRPLPAIALSSDPSTVTALANDYGFDQVFARQVSAFAHPGDLLVAISTSGRSPNILHALSTARACGLKTIALFGPPPSPPPPCDLALSVPSPNPQRIQELHTAILHALCAEVETRLTTSSHLETQQ